MKMFRLLRADEIECRVQKVTQKGVVLLLYKTARTDADLLDETVGPDRWQNDFKVVDGTLYGGIGIIYPEANGECFWKWDAGTESNTEAEKGRASDAFKRAGFKWGIGRELYSSPFTFIPAAKCNIKDTGKKDARGNPVYSCFDEFEVSDIQYRNERVSYLRITVKGLTVFEWGTPEIMDAKADKTIGIPLTCEDCGRPIKNGKKKDGSPWYAEEIAAYTKSFSGRCLCIDCGKVAKAKEGEIRR